ncbi:MAG: hypothetical protein AAFW47_07180 [Pseudomonadota bacterium]
MFQRHNRRVSLFDTHVFQLEKLVSAAIRVANIDPANEAAIRAEQEHLRDAIDDVNSIADFPRYGWRNNAY